MPDLSLDLMTAFRRADEIAAIADRFGYTLPAEHADALATAAAAQRIADTPQPQLPATLPAPGKVEATVAKHAAERGQWQARAEVAAHLHEMARRTAARIAHDVTGPLAAHLADAAVPVFTRLGELLDTAPHTIGGYESAADVAAHTELLRLAGEAGAWVTARAQVAAVSGEGAALGNAAAFLVIDPDTGATTRDVDAAVLAVASDGFPTDIAGWAELHPLGLHLAGPGEAAARLAAYSAARQHLINTPAGGMLDHTIAELTALGRGGPSRRSVA